VLCLKGFFGPAVGRACGLALALLISPLLAASGQSLPQPINLSSMVGGGSKPVMALETKGAIDIAWVGTGVFFARSADAGATFSTTTVLPMSSPPVGVQMGLDSAGAIDLLWPTAPDNTHPGGSAFFSRSTDSGLTFSTPTRFNPTGGVTSSAIELTVEPGGAIDIIWLDQLRANLFFARSTDGGGSFSAPVRVWATSGDLADLRAVTSQGGQLYVFWTHIASATQCDVLFTRTLDAGVTFSSVANLSNTTSNCSASARPRLDPNGGINVAWLVDNQSVWFSHSTDFGASFAAPVNASGGARFFVVSDQGVIADASGEVNLVWTGSVGQSAVFLANSNDHGATFSVPKIVSLPPKPNNTGGGTPAVGEDSCGDIFVAWSDDSVGAVSGEFDVFLGRSADKGLTFSNPLDLSNTASDAEVLSQFAVEANGTSDVLWTTTNFPTNVFFARVPPSLPQNGDFEIAVLPGEVTAMQGATDQFLVAALTIRAPGESLSLGCSGLPPFATCTFNPAALTTQPFFTPSVMTLTVPSNLPAGTYLFAVNGVSASTVSTQTVELIVQAPPATTAARSRVRTTGRPSSPDSLVRSRGLVDSTVLRAMQQGHGLPLAPELACSSGNERLCAALRSDPPHPRLPRSRRCRADAVPKP
jgi:hypothetical protein